MCCVVLLFVWLLCVSPFFYFDFNVDVMSCVARVLLCFSFALRCLSWLGLAGCAFLLSCALLCCCVVCGSDLVRVLLVCVG